MQDGERLFRDAEGAALERVARLEDENRRLRAEVDRLSAQQGVARHGTALGHPLPGRFIVLAMALPLGIVSLLLAVGPRHHPRACPSMSPRSFQVTPYAPLPATCTQPYSVDARGGRHYAPECLR